MPVRRVKAFLSPSEVSNVLRLGKGWQKGRSGAYFRSSQVALPFGIVDRAKSCFDLRGRANNVCVLHMPEGSSLGEHGDDHPRGEMQVLVMLQPAESGGILILRGHGAQPTEVGEAIVFNANAIKHEVTKVEKGDRFVLSMWFVL